MKINAGIFQYKMRDETPLRRVQRLEEKLQKTDGLDLIVCPELFLSGYGSFEKIKEFCEQSDGEYANKISLLAKKYSTAILYGYPEMAKTVCLTQLSILIVRACLLQTIAKKCCRLLPTSQRYLNQAARAR